jgi:hypothetical protein
LSGVGADWESKMKKRFLPASLVEKMTSGWLLRKWCSPRRLAVSWFGALFSTKKMDTKLAAAELQLEYSGAYVRVGSGAINPARTVNNSNATGLAVPVLYR